MLQVAITLTIVCCGVAAYISRGLDKPGPPTRDALLAASGWAVLVFLVLLWVFTIFNMK